jgi:hypothetical protein
VSLLDDAAADLAGILSDATGGFAVPIQVIPPRGRPALINGIAQDIGSKIDPGTGVMVSGRSASVALPILALRAAELEDPVGVAGGTDDRPWLVKFTLKTGTEQMFKVTSTMPDKLGCIVCFLDEYFL